MYLNQNINIARKKFHEKEIEDFCEEEYFNFEDLIFGEKKLFGKIFGSGDVSTKELKIHFRKILVMTSLSQNLQNSAFSLIFHPIFSRINCHHF